MRQMHVVLPGVRVGLISQNRDGLVRFEPDTAWEQAQMPRLGLDFLRDRRERWSASELPSWFENLLPERDTELRARLCEMYGLREGQSFALLSAVGRDLTGAVELERIESGSDPQVGVEIGEGKGDAMEADSSERLSALTGMQMKFAMSMVNQRLVLPARDSQSDWIVKFPGDYEELAEVETSTMQWAQESGFDVPLHRTIPVTDLGGIPEGWIPPTRSAFAVKRFDRRNDGSKVHQEDLCQALGLRPSEKYGDRGNPVSLDGALRLVVDACGEADGREMARRIGFVIGSGNTDAHLKNWSLQWGASVRPKLTPCYDLVSTIAWEKFGWQRKGGPELALKLGGEKRFALLDDDALNRCAKSSFSWVSQEIRSGIERSRESWRRVTEKAPTRMLDAVREHWMRVPLLQRMGGLPETTAGPNSERH